MYVCRVCTVYKYTMLLLLQLCVSTVANAAAHVCVPCVRRVCAVGVRYVCGVCTVSVYRVCAVWVPLCFATAATVCVPTVLPLLQACVCRVCTV